MDIRTQIFVIVIAVLALVILVNMLRKRTLELRYALLWVVMAIGILIFACFPGLTKWLAGVLGIDTPINMLFFAGFCFALAIIFFLTVVISRMANRVKKLTQEMALLKKELEDRSEN